MSEKKKPGRPRAKNQKPMLPAKIIEAYVEAGSLEKTVDRVGVAPNTVKAIFKRCPEDFTSAKKSLATRMLLAADDATRIAAERIEECSSPQAAVVAGIMAHRATELLQGYSAGVTVKLVALLRANEDRIKQLDAEVAKLDEIIEAEGAELPEEPAKGSGGDC